jgi:23S rRNA G2445 N2-methylase RlmL
MDEYYVTTEFDVDSATDSIGTSFKVEGTQMVPAFTAQDVAAVVVQAIADALESLAATYPNVSNIQSRANRSYLANDSITLD